MSQVSENVAWQLQAFRDRFGTAVRFNDVDYPVIVEETAGAKVGTQTLSHTLGPFIAAADPHVFRFSPNYFQPTTDVAPPRMGDTFIWHDRTYLITDTTFADWADDTSAILVYAYWRDYASAGL